MRKLIALLFIICFCIHFASAQTKFTVSGYVLDRENSEKLIGASIYVPALQKGTTTNNYGFYTLTLPLQSDSLEVEFSYLGYAKVVRKVAFTQNQLLVVALQANSFLKPVEVTAEREENHLPSTQMSINVLPIAQLKLAPVLLGEADLMKTLQLLPGIKMGNEGSAGLHVRGGSPDQNLILLDGVPVYNAFHLFGFMSVFNTDALNHIKIFKGGMPARYGERLSSVLDISMKEGNLKETSGSFALSPIAGRFTIETPLKKDKTAFIISGRRTWIDALGKTLFSSTGQLLGYGFWDINAKVNTILNEKNRIYASVYAGKDRFKNEWKGDNSESSFDFYWGNTTAVVRLNSILSPKIFSNTSLSYSEYNFYQAQRLRQEQQSYLRLARSGIRDWSLKTDIDYEPNPNHAIKFGAKLSSLKFNPEVIRLNSPNTDTTFNEQNFVRSLNIESYIEDEITITPKLKTNLGLRTSLFHVEGKNYANLQPRLAMSYLLAQNLSFKASYTYLVQYIHLLTNSSLGLPTDLWVSSTALVKPQNSEQVAIGLQKNLPESSLEISLEGYYKQMNNLLEYKEGASFLYGKSTSWEDKVTTGKGEAYGLEILINKTKGRLNGWFGYTLAWSNRTFAEVNQGETFPFRYDRRHDFSLLVNLKLNTKKLNKTKNLSLAFVYSTGNAISLPEANYQGQNPANWDFFGLSSNLQNAFESQPYIAQRNGFRMPAYHRLDFSYHTLKNKQKVKRSWTLSLYNAYNRLNPYFIYETQSGFKKFTLFPVIPSVTYRIEW